MLAKEVSLIALNRAVDAPGVLLREKSAGYFVEEIAIEAHGANGDEEHGELMAEDHAETAVVDANDAVEGAFCEAVRDVVLPFFVAEKSGRTSWAW